MPGTDIETRQDHLPARLPGPGPGPGLPGRKRESEAAPARLARWARRERQVSVPLAVPPVVWTAAEIMHANGVGWEALAAGVMGSVSVWFFAPHKWTGKKGEPRWPEVWYARVSAIALSGWLTAATFTGPVSGAGPELGGSLFVTCSAWGYFWWRHHRVRGAKDREKFLAGCRAFWDGHAHAFGAGGSNVIDAEENPSQLRLRIQLLGGKQSMLTLQGSVHLIESAVPVGRGMVRIDEVEGNASQADVFITRQNPLRDVVEWDQSLAPASVHEQAVAGLSETGDLVRAPMRVNAFINGRTRSGKGNHLLLRAAQLSGCPDDRVVVIDLKQRAARTLFRSGGMEYVITDRAEAYAYLLMLKAERAARAREADTDDEQLMATVQTPALHTLIDEANPLTSVMAGDARCAAELGLLAAEGSGLEEYVEAYSQYGALAESVQSEQARSNLPLRICYAVESRAHGEFALGDGGGDASKLKEKGEFLMKLGPKARRAKLRAPHMPFKLFIEIVSANAERLDRRPLLLWCGGEPSVVPGQTWQEWHDRRFLRIDPAFRKSSPQYAAAAEQFGEPGAAPSQTAPGAEFSRPRLSPLAPGDPESGAAVAARIAEETDGPDVSPTAETRALGGKIYAQSEDRFFDLLAAAPPSGARTADLIAGSGMSNGQAYKILNRLADRGAVTQPGRGLYAPVPGRDARAEYTAIRAGDDALGRGAADRVARHLASVG
jgi:hypothetical protein